MLRRYRFGVESNSLREFRNGGVVLPFSHVRSAETEMGAMITKAARSRVVDMVDRASAEGARVVPRVTKGQRWVFCLRSNLRKERIKTAVKIKSLPESTD